MHALQSLRYRISLFARVGPLRSTFLKFLRCRPPFANVGSRALGVLVLLVGGGTAVRSRCWQHEICHRHVALQLLYIWVQRLPCRSCCFQRASKQLAKPDECLSVRPQQLSLRHFQGTPELVAASTERRAYLPISS